MLVCSLKNENPYMLVLRFSRKQKNIISSDIAQIGVVKNTINGKDENSNADFILKYSCWTHWMFVISCIYCIYLSHTACCSIFCYVQQTRLKQVYSTDPQTLLMIRKYIYIFKYYIDWTPDSGPWIVDPGSWMCNSWYWNVVK